jgi:hypothetical protein
VHLIKNALRGPPSLSVFVYEVIPKARSPPSPFIGFHKNDEWRNAMDKPIVGIVYKLANGKRIRIDVSIDVKELLEQSDRQIRSQKRKDRRYLDFVENVDELDTLPTQPQEDTAALVCMMDRCTHLYASIEKLPKLQRRRILLYFFKRLSLRQIAEMEGVSTTAVADSIKRALVTLKKMLAE